MQGYGEILDIVQNLEDFFDAKQLAHFYAQVVVAANFVGRPFSFADEQLVKILYRLLGNLVTIISKASQKIQHLCQERSFMRHTTHQAFGHFVPKIFLVWQ